METVCIEITGTGERRAIERPIWITRNRNGIHATPHRTKAVGVGDGEQIWSLGKLEGWPKARIITRAEYEERPARPEEDPELTAEAALAVMMGGSI